MKFLVVDRRFGEMSGNKQPAHMGPNCRPLLCLKNFHPPRPLELKVVRSARAVSRSSMVPSALTPTRITGHRSKAAPARHHTLGTGPLVQHKAAGRIRLQTWLSARNARCRNRVGVYTSMLCVGACLMNLRSIMAQQRHFELRLSLLIEELSQLRTQHRQLLHPFNLVAINVDGVAYRLAIVSGGLEAGLSRHSQTFGEVVVQQTHDRRDLDRLSAKVHVLLMWLHWLIRVFKWWCKQRLKYYMGIISPAPHYMMLSMRMSLLELCHYVLCSPAHKCSERWHSANPGGQG
jgi:hypothetical protein